MSCRRRRRRRRRLLLLLLLRRRRLYQGKLAGPLAVGPKNLSFFGLEDLTAAALGGVGPSTVQAAEGRGAVGPGVLVFTASKALLGAFIVRRGMAESTAPEVLSKLYLSPQLVGKNSALKEEAVADQLIRCLYVCELESKRATLSGRNEDLIDPSLVLLAKRFLFSAEAF